MINRRRLFLVTLLLTSGAAFAAWLRSGRPEHGIDDGQIFLTYADNFVQGHGFVYNPGSERVEGFTSCLWLAVCIAAAWLAPGDPEPILFGISTLITATTIMLTADAVGRIAAKQNDVVYFRIAVLLTCAWLLTNFGFLVWSTLTLIDVGLWSLVVTAGTLTCAHTNPTEPSPGPPWALMGLTVTALVTRPESLLICSVWVAALGWTTFRRTHSFRRTWRRIGPIILVEAVTFGAITAFRLLYFGYPWPNTYYSKVSDSTLYNVAEGVIYAVKFPAANPVAAGMLSACSFLLIWLLRRSITSDESGSPASAGENELAVPLTAVTICCIPFAVGGDHFALFRFYQPLWPLLAIAFAYSLQLLWEAVPTKHFSAPLKVLTAACLLTVVVAAQIDDWRAAPLTPEFRIADGGLLIGSTMNEFFGTADPPTIGVIAAGGIARAYRGPVIDLMGLNNVAMGHSPGSRRGVKNHAAFSRDVFFLLNPDLVEPKTTARLTTDERTILAHSSWANEAVLRGLYDDARFRTEYAPVMLSKARSEIGVYGFGKRSSFSKLEAAGITVRSFPWPEVADPTSTEARPR